MKVANTSILDRPSRGGLFFIRQNTNADIARRYARVDILVVSLSARPNQSIHIGNKIAVEDY